MSLKAFHIIFIAFSVLLAVGFGIWAINDWMKHGHMSSAALGFGSLLGSVMMFWYGVWFWRKLKRFSWL